MRAYLLTRHGGLDTLSLRTDQPIPEPGPGEVRIRVTAAGLNNTDIWSREGAYGTPDNPEACAGWKRVPLSFPRVQGGDIAGRIDAVGDGIDSTRVDERIVVNPVLYGMDRPSGGLRDCRLVGSEIDGGFAEYAVVPAENAIAVETNLEDTELASLPIAYLTAEHMLARAGLRAAESVLVTGASGGVGSALVQLAKARGATVLAIAGASKRDAVASLGADHVIAREAFERNGIGALPGARNSIDLVADIVAGQTHSALLNALGYNGRYVTAGAIAGPLVDIDLRTVYLQHLTLLGSTLGTRDDFARLVNAVAKDRIRPAIAATYPLERLREAQTHFQQKDFIGNIVVRP